MSVLRCFRMQTCRPFGVFLRVLGGGTPPPCLRSPLPFLVSWAGPAVPPFPHLCMIDTGSDDDGHLDRRCHYIISCTVLNQLSCLDVDHGRRISAYANIDYHLVTTHFLFENGSI